MEEGASDPHYMQSLARGLLVLETFAKLGSPLSVPQITRVTGLSRAVVARCLHTLTACGYVTLSDHRYNVLPHVLLLAESYLSERSLPVLAQPILERLRDTLGESCSMGMLDGDDIVYVARASSSRIITVALHVGSRLPAHCTSIGRVLLSGLPRHEREAVLTRADLTQRTPHSLTDIASLRATIDRDRRRDYALVDQELELGLRSIAVPVRSSHGTIMAAVNVGASAARLSVDDLETHVLPALREAAAAIGRFAA